MSLVRRNTMLFPSLMGEIFRPDWFGGMENFNEDAPAVNIKENEKDFELEFAVPGRQKDDFKIEIDNNVLTVSSETKTEDEAVEGNYTRREFSISSFKRVFTLPETIDEDKIKASYENGMLKFSLPKKKEALPKAKRLIDLA
ncbi:MAG: Hsp20/alpha crystallin family protein [Flavobacteriaceae bacterium]